MRFQHPGFALHRAPVFAAAVLFIFSACIQAYGQKVTLKWYNPTVELAFGDIIKVRMMNGIPGNNLNINHYLMTFDQDRKNAFRDGFDREIFVPYIELFYGPDPTPDQGAISIQKESNVLYKGATIDFATSDDESPYCPRMTDYALGYGLYFICIEIPCYHTCTHIDANKAWFRAVIPIDFRDSRYPYSSVSNDIEIRFSIKPFPQECQTYHPFDGQLGSYLSITSESGTQSLHPSLIEYETYLDVAPIQYIQDLCDASGTPESDFSIENDLLPPGYAGMLSGLILNHPATIRNAPQGFSFPGGSPDPNQGFRFIVSTEHIIENGQNQLLSRNEDLELQLEDLLYFRKSNGNADSDPGLCLKGADGKKVIVRPHPLCMGIVTGLYFENNLYAEYDGADLELPLPLVYIGANTRDLLSTYTGPTCIVKNSSIVTTAPNPSQDAMMYALRPCALYLENACFEISNNQISGTPSWAVQSGIIAKGYTFHSFIGGNDGGNTISNFIGYGMECVDVSCGDNVYNSMDVLAIRNNQVFDNKMHGTLVRGGESRIYFGDNNYENNGHFGDATPDLQGRKCDAVHVNAGTVSLERNILNNSGAYGLHITDHATAYGYSFKTSAPVKNNCFQGNYFNLGANISSIGYFGNRANYGWNNLFDSPRATYQAVKYQATVDGQSMLFAESNYWAKPNLTLPLDQVISEQNGGKAYVTQTTDQDPPCAAFGIVPYGNSSPPTQNEPLVQAILDMSAAGDWTAVQALSMQLMASNPEPVEITIACERLSTAYEYLNDTTILIYLYNLANNNILNPDIFFPSINHSMRGYTLAGNYPESIRQGNMIVQHYPQTQQWKSALLHNAYILYEKLSNRASAADNILAALSVYPDDAEAITAHWSVMNELPPGVAPKRSSSGPDAGKSFRIYPNPANDVAYVHAPDKDGFITGTAIYSRLGSLLRMVKTEGKSNYAAVDLRGLESGVYFLEVRTNHAIKMHKLIKR